MPSSNRILGAFGEETACTYLRRKGYTIVERNFLCRMGEIDIIARNRRYIVFAEVKLRKDASHGQALEFVTPAKQRRVVLAAEKWLQGHATKLQPRFDVIEIYAPDGLATTRPEIHHIEDAF